MPRLTKEQIIKKISSGKLLEVLIPNVELKSSWRQEYGKDISAIANHFRKEGGWIILGINDDGTLSEWDDKTLIKTESQVTNHINEYLEPNFKNVIITGEIIDSSHILLIEIIPIDEIVYWNEKAHKLLGTSSPELSPSEILSLSLELPGQDFSKLAYTGKLNSSLIMGFAEKINENAKEKLNLNNISSLDILSNLGIHNKNVSGILFGDFPIRIIHCDINGDILDQEQKFGLYNLLEDQFINQIQSWTRKQVQIVDKSFSAKEEQPYPIEALRESLANAVAHSFYQKDYGDITVEIFPNKISITNNSSLEAEAFVDKWFSRIHNSQNKLLMNTLRMSKLTEELGSGKNRIFRQMIEHGKREPIIEFQQFKNFGKWKITLYNEENNLPITLLINRLKEYFSNSDEWRLATAIVLWKNKTWNQILSFLDEHYIRVTERIIENSHSPVIPNLSDRNSKPLLKRWVMALFQNQTIIPFSTDDELTYLNEFRILSKKMNGILSNIQAREHIGLTNTKAEISQLTNLFTKWQKQGLVKKSLKRGEWIFLNN